jgi:branched-chain amino acid transport system permease protein
MLGFAISAAVAGFGGALYTATTSYVGPTAFDLAEASQFLLWVVAGGLGTLAGPVAASFAFQFISSLLGANQSFNTDLVFGLTIILFVTAAPQGLMPVIRHSLAKAKVMRERTAAQ